MKVGFVTRAPVVWGAERSLLLLTSALQSLGCECVILVDEASPLRQHLEDDRRAHVVVQLPSHPALATGSLANARPSDVRAELARGVRVARELVRSFEGLDMVICFDVWDAPAVLLAARIRRLPVWLDLHETFTGGLGSLAFRSLARFFDGIVAPTEVVLSSVPESERKARVVVPRPVQIDLHRPGASVVGSLAPALPPRVGIVGQIEPHKGHEIFLRALKIVQRAMPCEGVVIGGAQRPEDAGTFERELRSRAVATGVSVTFVPWTADVRSELRQLTVLVNISAHEAFGRTVVEGIGEGIYPIVNRATGAAEIVRDLGIGGLVDADPDSLAEGIVAALTQPAELMRAQVDGPLVAAARYAPARVAREYLLALSTAECRFASSKSRSSS